MSDEHDPFKTHYLCELCGGIGRLEAGCYSPETKKYDLPAGVCDHCGGTGYLGPYEKPELPTEAELDADIYHDEDGL
jgi:hypothetical protein